jgi:hypothetical protein
MTDYINYVMTLIPLTVMALMGTTTFQMKHITQRKPNFLHLLLRASLTLSDPAF